MARAASDAQASAGTDPLQEESMCMSDTVIEYLKKVTDGKKHLSEEQLQELHGTTSGAPLSGHTHVEAGRLDFKGLLDYMASEKANAMAPAPKTDTSYPISSYFISSSHNTYLQGNQLWGDASSEVYANILRRGCRCVEIDVHNGSELEDNEEETKRGFKAFLSKKIDRLRKDSPDRGRRQGNKGLKAKATSGASRSRSAVKRAEPRVLHGYTLTKEVSFRDVCKAIRDAAFVTSDLPVIVSLEVHADDEQQKLMVNIMKEEWQGLMVQPESEGSPSLPTLAEVQRKLLVKVKAGAKDPAPHAETIAVASAEQPTTEDSTSSSDEEPDGKKVQSSSRKKKQQIIGPLSSMGVYTRGYHFKNFSTPEAEIPTHVFSLSEKKLMDVSANHSPQLLAHNQRYLMRAYPSGMRVSSTNFDPSVYWRMGVQIAALNWQSFDAGVMLNEGEFAGTGGWVLKPPGYREERKTGHTVPEEGPHLMKRHESIVLGVEILAAQGLPLHSEVSKPEQLRPYVKCMLHIEGTKEQGNEKVEKGKKNKQKLKWRSKTSHGAGPDFKGDNARFAGAAVSEELSFIRFKIQDDVRGRDILLAWACIRLDRLRTGLRYMHLLDANGVDCSAALLVNITKHTKAS